MFTREYLFSWRHLEINSVLLLRLLVLSALIMKSFSVWQRLHRLEILLQAVAEEMIDQLILQFSQLSLSFQMCFANSVRLAYFLLRNDSLCYVYRCLNVPSVSPMQFFPVSSLPVVTLALYITLVRIFLLRLLMMLPMFGMQLQLTFTFFLLKTGYRLWFGGKCFLIRLWKVLATLVRTSLQYGVNQMMFHFLFLFVGVVVFSCSREGLR